MKKSKSDTNLKQATNFPILGIFILVAMGIATIVYFIYNKYKEVK